MDVDRWTLKPGYAAEKANSSISKEENNTSEPTPYNRAGTKYLFCNEKKQP